MTRKDFIQLCGVFGIALPTNGLLYSCNPDEDTLSPFSGKVVVIGAGAGGMSTGYFLNQQGVDFEILEASAAYGGRIRINTNFADFPIPLGAEWIETSNDIFEKIVNDSQQKIHIKTHRDDPDLKFINYSWFNFFDDYIVPSIKDRISLSSPVSRIDYTGDKIIITTPNRQINADKVVISIPLRVLKDGDITFEPAIPQSKLKLINELDVWSAFKAFFEFKTNFYGNNEYVFPVSPASTGQKLYYNAALGQETSKNILGFFVVGTPADDYISRTGNDLRNFILNEMDKIYNNQASPNYTKHITQNWNNEPFIRGGYLTDHADWRKVRDLGSSIDRKIYFAGGEYTDGEDWVSVHTAALSAKRTVLQLSR